MPSRVSISTTVYSKAYLAVAWKSRDQLKNYERRGFAQFFYLTLCGHIEGAFAGAIQARLHFIPHIVKWESLPPLQLKENETVHYCPVDPLVESLRRIIKALSDESESAPLAKLIEIYGRVFPAKLSETLGTDLHQDLQALAALRNLFAHGREFFLNFDDPLFEGKATLDGNPLKLPADRLRAAGLIENFQVTGQNHDQFAAKFFSDSALLYFFNAAKKIESALNSHLTFAPEASFRFLQPLPDITA